jgi:hypothetical protein
VPGLPQAVGGGGGWLLCPLPHRPLHKLRQRHLQMLGMRARLQAGRRGLPQVSEHGGAGDVVGCWPCGALAGQGEHAACLRPPPLHLPAALAAGQHPLTRQQQLVLDGSAHPAARGIICCPLDGWLGSFLMLYRCALNYCRATVPSPSPKPQAQPRAEPKAQPKSQAQPCAQPKPQAQPTPAHGSAHLHPRALH